MIMFWMYFHTFMITILAVAYMITAITSAGKEIYNIKKFSDTHKEYYFGEIVMLIIIIFAIISLIEFIIYNVAKRNPIAAGWFCRVIGILYVYIAVRQIAKMLFVPEKKLFTNSDINNFICTYIGWWLIALVVAAIEEQGGILEKIKSQCEEAVKGGLVFLWYYFNILFAIGGLYILLCLVLNLVKDMANRIYLKVKKIATKASGIYDLRSQKEKFDELRSYRLWRENSGKGVVYKGIMTIPLLVVDIGRITCLFAKYLLRMSICFIFGLIFEPVSVLYKCAKNLWNRYENNEWMYLVAQIAGIVSCFIVILSILYGEYEEKTKSIYEFVGTIVFVPYFLGKIKGAGKKLGEEDTEMNTKKENM